MGYEDDDSFELEDEEYGEQETEDDDSYWNDEDYWEQTNWDDD